MSKVVLITGGSRGIGAAVARQAAAAQYAVAISYVGDKTAADALLAELKAAGAKAITVQGDVAKLADVIRLFDETEGLGACHHSCQFGGHHGSQFKA